MNLIYKLFMTDNKAKGSILSLKKFPFHVILTYNI